MNKKIARLIALSIYVALFALFVVVPSVWVYAQVSTCGWKGLFVECRIQECGK
jgi:hypothetical protein